MSEANAASRPSVTMTLKNYRCFVRPTAIDICPGFTAFVGPNNAGKSAALRFLLEFRGLFELADDLQSFPTIVGGSTGLSIGHVLDPHEVLSNLNDEPLVCSFEFSGSSREPHSERKVQRATFTLDRGCNVTAEIVTANRTLNRDAGGARLKGSTLTQGDSVADVSNLQDFFKKLKRTHYVGSFRNAINAGTKLDYFDMQVGEAFIDTFRTLKTGPTKANNLAVSRIVEDIRSIFEFDSLSIEPTSDNKSLHFTVNGKPYKQHELGSGLMQFVMVLVNASVANPDYLLIDEPELSLHPALQTMFLQAVGRYVPIRGAPQPGS